MMHPTRTSPARRLVLGAALLLAVSPGCARKQDTVVARAEASAPEAGPGPTAAAAPAPALEADAAAPEAPADLARREAPALEAKRPSGAPFSSLENLPLVPMGKPLKASVLDGMPGYVPPDDPERDSVERGRRLVDPMEGELSGGFDSPEALARAILDGLAADDPAALHSLRITREEFALFFWPEFPASRPVNNLVADDAWTFHNADCHDGVSELLSAFGGKRLVFDYLEFTAGVAPYTNFKLYHGAQIHARDEFGQPVTLGHAPLFAERNGRWKIYILED